MSVLAMALLTLPGAGCRQPVPPPASPPRTIQVLPVHASDYFREELDPVGPLAFSPDGKLLAAAADETTVRLYDVTSGTVARTLKWDPLGPWRGWANTLVFSPDGQTLATGHTDHTVLLWDVATGRLTGSLIGHTQAVLQAAFNSDGQMLATGSADGTARLWDVRDRLYTAVLKAQDRWVSLLALAPDGKHLATAGLQGPAQLWAVPSGRLIATLTVPPSTRTSRPTPSHSLAIKLGIDRAVSTLKFSPDGRMLATCHMDGATRLWNLPDGRLKTTLKGHIPSTAQPSPFDVVRALAFSPDGKILATASEDQTAHLWDVTTGRENRILTGHIGMLYSLAFSPNGKLLVTGSHDKTARLWSVRSGELKATLQGHKEGVYTVAFTPDGKILATGSADKTVRLWDVSGMR